MQGGTGVQGGAGVRRGAGTKPLAVPAGSVGLDLMGQGGTAYVGDRPVRVEDLDALLDEYGVAHRPRVLYVCEALGGPDSLAVRMARRNPGVPVTATRATVWTDAQAGIALAAKANLAKASPESGYVLKVTERDRFVELTATGSGSIEADLLDATLPARSTVDTSGDWQHHMREQPMTEAPAGSTLGIGESSSAQHDAEVDLDAPVRWDEMIETHFSHTLEHLLDEAVVAAGEAWLDNAEDRFGTADSQMFERDMFDDGRPRDAPEFLQGYQFKELPTELYAAFLERLSLTQDEPTKQDLTPEALKQFRDARADTLGRDKHVLTADKPKADNPFGEEWMKSPYQGKDAPTDQVEMALIRHAVWLGTPLVEDTMMVDGQPRPGPKSMFRKLVGESAREHQGDFATVVWTDLDRAVARYARQHPGEKFYQGKDLEGIRSMLDWADEYVIYSVLRGMRTRHGDLHLTRMDEVVEDLPYPPGVWRAVLRFIAARDELRDRVRSITRYGFRHEPGSDDPDAGKVHPVDLPEDVLAMFSVPTGWPDLTEPQLVQPGETAGWILGEYLRRITMHPLDALPERPYRPEADDDLRAPKVIAATKQYEASASAWFPDEFPDGQGVPEPTAETVARIVAARERYDYDAADAIIAEALNVARAMRRYADRARQRLPDGQPIPPPPARALTQIARALANDEFAVADALIDQALNLVASPFAQRLRSMRAELPDPREPALAYEAEDYDAAGKAVLDAWVDQVLPAEREAAAGPRGDLTAQVVVFEDLLKQFRVARRKPDGFPGSLKEFLKAADNFDADFDSVVKARNVDNPFRPALFKEAEWLLGQRQRHIVTGAKTNRYLTIEMVAAELDVKSITLRNWGLVERPPEQLPAPTGGREQLTPSQVAQRWTASGYQAELVDWLAAYQLGEARTSSGPHYPVPARAVLREQVRRLLATDERDPVTGNLIDDRDPVTGNLTRRKLSPTKVRRLIGVPRSWMKYFLSLVNIDTNEFVSVAWVGRSPGTGLA